ncbi:MAG: chromate efflux transporter [Pseudomonadota bacterium]|nr:chromate efflux transporter [Pseudomonadota bacterium]
MIFLHLGLTAFGGPVAHLGHFRQAFVVRRQWLSEAAYADLVALCQFLPGPASSQVGMALGLQRAGYAGAAAAWIGFTLPSALVLVLLALGMTRLDTSHPAMQGIWHGLAVAATAVVAQAVWGMARTLTPDTPRRAIALLTAGAALCWPGPWVQIVLITLAGAVGAAGLSSKSLPSAAPESQTPQPHALGLASFWLLLFAALLLGLPLLASVLAPDGAVALVDVFYRAGALVFGGGHVVLPLLQAEVVPTGWVSQEQFLAGYGAAQAMPGPLFSFAAFLGAARVPSPTGWVGGGLALLAIFAPAFLLVAGVLPYWARLRQHRRARHILAAVNAAVVGLLLAALVDPIGTHGLRSVPDALLAATALLALTRLTLPPWAVVLACGAAGAAMALA